MKRKTTKPVYRSAYSGKFVSKKYVRRNPRETVTEHVKRGRVKK